MSRNEDLAEYAKITDQLDKLEKRKAELREGLIQIGTHSSLDYICTVATQDRRSIALKDLEAKHPAYVAKFVDEGIVKTYSMAVVTVRAKDRKAA